MLDHVVDMRLTAKMEQGLWLLARERDQTPGQVIRELLVAELKRKPAKTPNRADEQLVARLQRLLAPVMPDATCWAMLQEDLRRIGYDIRPAGGGLTIHDSRTGDRLRKSSELGFPYSPSFAGSAPPCPAIRIGCSTC